MHRCRPSRPILSAILSCWLLAAVAGATVGADGDHPVAVASPATSVPAASVPTEDLRASDSKTPELPASTWGGPVSPLAISIDVQPTSSCTPCSSPQGSCTTVGQCNVYCQALVGENGFCMTTGCNCCVCPDALPDPGDGEDFPDNCQPVCRCGDGVQGPQGACDEGCRQVNCL